MVQEVKRKFPRALCIGFLLLLTAGGLVLFELSENRDTDDHWVEVGKWAGNGPETTEPFVSQSGELRVTYAVKSESKNAGFLKVEVKERTHGDAYVKLDAEIGSIFEGKIEVEVVPPQGETHVVFDEKIDGWGEEKGVVLVHGKPGNYRIKTSASFVGWEITVEDMRKPQSDE